MDEKSAWSIKHERLIIAALCVIGTIRVFIFNAAFPPFNNVDEQAHFDLVYKYSRLNIPKAGVVQYSREVLESVIIHGSRQYVAQPQDRIPPPLWTIPGAEKSPEFAQDVSDLQQRVGNHEAASFPVYYLAAGLWYKTGEALGLSQGQLIYWIRFLNVPVFVLLILTSFVTAKNFYTEGDTVRTALPLLVTFFPQDVFYSISNDAITPLLFGIAFLMLVQIYNHDKSCLYHFIAGLFVAATFLTKVSNITVIFFLGAVLLFKMKKLYAEKQIKQYFSRLVILPSALLIPAGFWLVRNYLAMGDAMGTAERTAYSGLTFKPMNQLLNHPIFTPEGISFFLAELTKTFWRGEFTWHYKTIASHSMDIFYIVLTGLFVAASAMGLLIHFGKRNRENLIILNMSFCALIISVLLLAVLSPLFDFGECVNPSREKPYFTAGRLIGGMLIPFLIIYLDGLKRLLSFLKIDKYLLLAVIVIIIAITVSEISISPDVFKSRYNWFHLR